MIAFPLAVVLAGLAAAASVETDRSGSLCHTVMGTSHGVDFGVVVKDRKYKYEAHGVIGFNMGCNGACTSAEADGNLLERGNPKPRQRLLTDLACPRKRIYSLVGRVGDRCVQLGKEGGFKAPASGPLRLYINDDSYGETEGGWDVCVFGIEPPEPDVRARIEEPLPPPPPPSPAPPKKARPSRDAEPPPYFAESPDPVKILKIPPEPEPPPPLRQRPPSPEPTPEPVAVPRDVDDLLAKKPEALPDPSGLPERAPSKLPDGGAAATPERAPERPDLESRPRRPSKELLPDPLGLPERGPAAAPAEKPLEDAERPLAFDAVPDLIEALRKGNRPLRYRAADELGRRGPEAAAALDALVDALKDREAAVRSSAALAIGNLGPAGRSAAASLKRLLKDPNTDVKNSAAFALKRLEGSGR